MPPPIAQPAPLHRRCPYCHGAVVIGAPYTVGTPRTAMVQCPRDTCVRYLRVTFIAGRPTGIMEPRKFRFSSRLRGEGPSMQPVANLLEEACESGYLGSPKAGAVALRAAAEVFSAVEFNHDTTLSGVTTLGKVLNRLDTYPGFQGLAHHKKGSVRAGLHKIRNIGDSAAHHRLDDESRRVVVASSAVEDGVGVFEDILTKVYGWA
jgi:hypothetical protein